MTSSIRRRIEKLERGTAAGDEISLGELVSWSMRNGEVIDQPELDAIEQRLARSRLGQLIRETISKRET
jgi:hypothetical protein